MSEGSAPSVFLEDPPLRVTASTIAEKAAEGYATVLAGEWVRDAVHEVGERRPFLALEALARRDRKSTRLNSSHLKLSRMPSSA